MTYRPDIDGLRAIAIILVLIYHGGLAFLPSGFVGVDVFFVISGFLITTIIHTSLNNNNFSFTEFYNRRLWRLQPVFVALIFLTLILTGLLFLPDDLVEFSRSARKTSLFMSNIFFNHTTTGYFSPDTHQLPLLHTWSLSIEWQCYLILPLLMYCLHRLLSKRNLIVVTYLLAGLTLLFSLHSSKEYPAQTYYLLSSRLFEFLIGSCIALLPMRKCTIHKYVLNITGTLAVLTIFYIAGKDHIVIGYPNWYAFAACLATGTLLALGKYAPERWIVKSLSVKPLVFIGVLSYSLYIWHWVVFSLLRYQSITETPLIIGGAYLATYILGYLSWKFIEKPARRFNQIQFRYTVVILVLLPVLVTHLSSYLIKIHSGFPQRFNEELVTVYQQLARYNSVQRPLCISNHKMDTAHCSIGSHNKAAKKGLLIGDSFSNHYWGFMDTLGKSANVSILAQGTSSCITLPGLALYDWWYFKNAVYEECVNHTEHYYQMIEQNHYDYVILGQVWSNYLSDSIINHVGDQRSPELTRQRLEIALDKAINIIISSGAKPVIMKTTALMKAANSQDCFFKHIKFHQPYDPKVCSVPNTLSNGELWFNALFAKMKAKYPQLVLIDPKDVQCQDNQCRADINGIPVYRDAGHITDYASYQYGKLYLERFGNPLNASS